MDDIKITIMEIKGRQVKVGIETPPELIAHREETYAKVLEENRLAARMSSESFEKIKDIWEKR